MKVALEPFNPAWITEFSVLKKSLEEDLVGIPYISIEHVGSTAIPGLVAKPVIDVDIIVTKETLPAVRQALVRAGYFDCGEMDIPGRYAFRQPGYGQLDAAWGSSGVGVRRQNTYAMIEGCSALRNHLDLKRVLCNDEELREEYKRVKQELAERDFNNIGEYVRGKNAILRKILTRAGWSEEDLDEVKRANS
ncbi:hypothetical protein PVAG01_10783 [Phlyctema vagabunda]|uniref:GrpB family protein n=1 Tax=Phlyctema vagabunda TaxID=108571 RepID=A0ABR4P396_9HELO